MKTGQRDEVGTARHPPNPISISISVHCSIAVQRGLYNNLNLSLKLGFWGKKSHSLSSVECEQPFGRLKRLWIVDLS